MRVIMFIIIGLLLIPLSNAETISISGTIHTFIGNYNGTYSTIYMLDTNNGMIQLDMSSYANTTTLDNRYVTLDGVFAQGGIFHVYSMQVLDAAKVDSIEASVLGEQAWVTILARFADISSTPKEPSFFDNLLYNDTYPSLNHYWQEVSYNTINITGGTYGWYDLTNNQTDYEGNSDPLCLKQPKFDLLLEDMATLADPFVDFNDYTGINLVYNNEIGNCVWGGSATLTIDGSTRTYRVTYLSPQGLEHMFFAHEIGHGFGLPHSSGSYGTPYDSEWDVMSKGSSCKIVDPEFNCMAVHTIAYHKALLGWIPSSNIYEASNNTITTIDLSPLENMSNGYMMAKVPISTDQFYTIEYRKFSGYDVNVPDDAIIIHHVDESRERPAQVIDVDNNGNPNDEGARWRVGEIFNDSVNNINITIIEDLGDHYRISISTSDLDLNAYTSSFIDNGMLDVLFILGDSNPHGPMEWGAGAIIDDVLGAIGVATKLGQLSSYGNSAQAIDTTIVNYDTATDIISIDWNNINSNIIAVGGPAVNLITYNYDKNKALPFYLSWNNSIPYIHSAISNMDYIPSTNNDYAIIGLVNDNGKDILLVWGITAKGTLAATQLLQYYDTIYADTLHGKAILLEWTDSNNDKLVDTNDTITIVERWQ